MRGKRFRIGSVAVLFSVVVLCVAIFSILTVVTAVSDRNMTERYAQQVTQRYDCLNQGEIWLSQADAYFRGEGQLPENTSEENGCLTAQLESDDSVLLVQAQNSPDGVQVLRWELTVRWQPEQGWTLLNGG